ncbi:MAG TPA: glycerol-3-phosphate dehydrogenase [Gammaproteobacteria bacterium]|nr:glycerol-3-phosphate dehydrogenase [Gammaproteobacteria bacterium]
MADTNSQDAIAIIGAGSWGTALAMHIAASGRTCYLWGHEADHQLEMQATHSNERFLPGIRFPDPLNIILSLDDLPNNTDAFLIVVPSHAFRDVLRQLHEHDELHPRIIAWGTKGLELGTCNLMSDIADSELPDQVQRVVISGPSFAGEVARGMPTAVSVASRTSAAANEVASWLHHGNFRAYTLEDMTGVQLGGSLKNVMAIAAGISDGLGFGANARAALITRGLAEISRLASHVGGNMETFMGLAGLGDLVLTCTDDQSRNRRCGLGLGAGKSLDAVVKEIGQEVEGIQSAAAAWELSRRHNVSMPITEQVHKVLYEGLPARDAVQNLLHREQKHE